MVTAIGVDGFKREYQKITEVQKPIGSIDMMAGWYAWNPGLNVSK